MHSTNDLNPDEPPFTTIGVKLQNGDRLYTYKCALPVAVGDRVNVKLPAGLVVTTTVQTVHEAPILSDKWQTKWSVVVQTAAEAMAEAEAARNAQSDLGRSLGL